MLIFATAKLVYKTIQMNAPSSPRPQRYNTFADFYPYYLSEHCNRICTRIHVIGTGLAITLLAVAFALHHWWLAILALLCGYGFAWIGHFFFEKNRPATFTYPLWSLLGDFRLFWETLIARRQF
jgi:hypothetical protein